MMKNSYRVAGPIVSQNFGMVEVAWDAADGPEVTLSLNTIDGAKPFLYSFPLKSIQ